MSGRFIVDNLLVRETLTANKNMIISGDISGSTIRMRDISTNNINVASKATIYDISAVNLTVTNLTATNIDISNNLKVKNIIITGTSQLIDISSNNLDVLQKMTVSGRTTLSDTSSNNLDVLQKMIVSGSTNLHGVQADHIDISANLNVLGVTVLRDISVNSIAVSGYLQFNSPIQTGLVLQKVDVSYSSLPVVTYLTLSNYLNPIYPNALIGQTFIVSISNNSDNNTYQVYKLTSTVWGSVLIYSYIAPV